MCKHSDRMPSTPPTADDDDDETTHNFLVVVVLCERNDNTSCRRARAYSPITTQPRNHTSRSARCTAAQTTARPA